VAVVVAAGAKRAVIMTPASWTIRKPAERVLIVGAGALARQVVEAFEARPGQRILGVVEDGGRATAAHLHLGPMCDLDQIVDRVRPDRVIVALTSRRGHMPFKTLLGLRVRGIAVEDGVDCYERLAGKVPIEALTPTSLIFSKDSRSRRTEMAMAWLLSAPLAVVALVLLAPLLALIALAIKLDSAGPVFFVQSRVGRGGRPFRLIKFRTMRPAAGATSEWVRDNRGRLTRVGRLLRRFRLDELPQFLNVAMGDMNLVGPRPHPVSNLSMLVLVARNTPECGEPIPFYALRSLVRPGLTGWAQVRYQYANDLEEEIEKMRYDLYYIKHRSLWLDLRIVLETVKIVVLGRESAERGRRAGDSAGSARPSAAPRRRPPLTEPFVVTPLAAAVVTPLAAAVMTAAPPVPIGAIPMARPDGQTAVRA
jgi:exopolysaccharide biosynthesis polyprenyl glycosylphosphotransferase